MHLSATVVHYMIQISSLHIRCGLVKFCRCFVESDIGPSLCSVLMGTEEIRRNELVTLVDI